LEGEHSGVPNNWRGNMLEYQILGGENSLEYQLIGGGENNWGSWKQISEITVGEIIWYPRVFFTSTHECPPPHHSCSHL